MIIDGGARFIRAMERFIVPASLIGDRPVFPPGTFDWEARVESQWRTVRAELDEVLRYRDHLPCFHEVSQDQWRLSSDDKWKTFFLYAYGEKAEANCARCPETTRLVESIPGMKTALFSILAPGIHIPSHSGPYKGVVRYQLALLVPEPRERCRIRIGDELCHGEEGKSIVFDDTFPHEVWNDTDGLRVVLFLDVVRPLRQPARLLNAAMLEFIRRSPFVQDGVERYKAWERKLEEVAGPPRGPSQGPQSATSRSSSASLLLG
jgi:beta-hydroxylase